jgi:polyisoprenoid-binding protein YceI
MKTYSNWITATLTGALALVVTTSLQAQMTRYEAQTTGSQVKIEGTSNIHDWDVKSPIIGGYLEMDSAFLASPKAGKVPAAVKVIIPVRSLKSYKTSMDEVMQEHMKMKQYPRIEYRLSELVCKEAKDAKSPMTFDAKGDLIVSGTTNSVTFPVTMTPTEDNKLKVTSGKIPLKMTSYNIKPPAPKIAMGLITTGDDVTITFEWMTAKAQ